MIITAIAGSAFLPGCDEPSRDKSKEMTLLASGMASNSPIESIYPGDNASMESGLDPLTLRIKFKGTLNAAFGTVRLNGVDYIDGDNCTMTITIAADTYTLNVALDSISPGSFEGITISGFHDALGILIPAYDNPHYNFTYI